MISDRKPQPLMEILPIVFYKHICFSKIRMQVNDELIDRFIKCKRQGSFEISKSVRPFYKKLI
jgi:hypothetical protein